MSTMANRIRVARWAARLSLRKLSDLSGVPLATVQRAEVGKEITLSNALLIAKALAYPVEELWDTRAVDPSGQQEER